MWCSIHFKQQITHNDSCYFPEHITVYFLNFFFYLENSLCVGRADWISSKKKDDEMSSMLLCEHWNIQTRNNRFFSIQKTLFEAENEPPLGWNLCDPILPISIWCPCVRAENSIKPVLECLKIFMRTSSFRFATLFCTDKMESSCFNSMEKFLLCLLFQVKYRVPSFALWSFSCQPKEQTNLCHHFQKVVFIFFSLPLKLTFVTLCWIFYVQYNLLIEQS